MLSLGHNELMRYIGIAVLCRRIISLRTFLVSWNMLIANHAIIYAILTRFLTKKILFFFQVDDFSVYLPFKSFKSFPKYISQMWKAVSALNESLCPSRRSIAVKWASTAIHASNIKWGRVDGRMELFPLHDLTHWGRDKWTPFGRRHFQVHFLEWKCLNSY